MCVWLLRAFRVLFRRRYELSTSVMKWRSHIHPATFDAFDPAYDRSFTPCTGFGTGNEWVWVNQGTQVYRCLGFPSLLTVLAFKGSFVGRWGVGFDLLML